MKMISNRVNPNNLKNHPLNIEIYGDKPDAEFVELVRKHGVLSPILITNSNQIISGHRRNQAAKLTDQKEVPVLICVDLKDETEIEQLLILSNEQRVKTTEVRAREYEHLKAIEERLAAKRMNFGGKTDPRENFPQGPQTGKSSDIAAAKVGMSGKTAEKAAKVVKKIDQLKDEGKTEEAAELTETLNKSVSGAAKKISEPKKPEKPKFDEKGLDDLLGKLIRKIDERAGFVKGRKGHTACVSLVRKLDAALKSWRAEG